MNNLLALASRSVPAGFVAGSGPQVTSVEDAPFRSSPVGDFQGSSPSPRQPGGSTAIIDQLIHERVLRVLCPHGDTLHRRFDDRAQHGPLRETAASKGCD